MRALFIFLFLIAVPVFAVDHSVYKGKDDCLSCHKMAFPSHRHDVVRPKHIEGKGYRGPLESPPGWPLDGQGKLICLTCHDCRSGNCILRQSSEHICRSCHDCSQGMACLVKVAHLGNKKDIEVHVNDCKMCHDGIKAKQASGPDMHPVDIVYIPKNQKYKQIKEEDREVVLKDGKITCLSCHDPYKNEKVRWSRENEKKTCRVCHIY